MERRKVLAAISAAIATPAGAWGDAHTAEQIAAGEEPSYSSASKVPYHPNLGLTALQADVRKALNERLLGQLDLLLTCSAGPQSLLDTWLLSEALMEWQSGEYSHDFCGLANSLLYVLQRDSRFVVAPEEMHEEVASFIEQRKAGPIMAYSPAFLRFQRIAGPEDKQALESVLNEYCVNHTHPDNHFCESAGKALFDPFDENHPLWGRFYPAT